MKIFEVGPLSLELKEVEGFGHQPVFRFEGVGEFSYIDLVMCLQLFEKVLSDEEKQAVIFNDFWPSASTSTTEGGSSPENSSQHFGLKDVMSAVRDAFESEEARNAEEELQRALREAPPTP